MTRADLIARIADRTGQSSHEVSRTIDALLGFLGEELMARRSVRLTRFGKFEVITRKQSRRKNPQTGELQVVPSRSAVAFRPSDILSEKVNDAANNHA